ncbi:MAG TPA: ABC transporter permease [Candidatus Nanopelagicaceae bacterium]|nr:ABC transporter permease [Candidatus Nanopelagicaceae bacterium]
MSTAKAARARLSTFHGSPTFAIGIFFTSFIFIVALVSLIWSPYKLDDTTGNRLEGPNATHLLGTDTLGRDLLSQLMVGARIAMKVGFGATGIALIIGCFLGLLAAFFPGWIDDTLASIFDTLIAFPTLLLAMLIIAAEGASLWAAILAIGIAASAIVSRIVRILTKRILAQQYVVAAKTCGTSRWEILRGHVLPNLWPTLIVNLAIIYGVAVLTEAGLSYLGLGAPPPSYSWGRLLREAQSTVLTAPLGAIAPGIAIILLVLGMNFVADGLRELFDPTQRGNS